MDAEVSRELSDNLGKAKVPIVVGGETILLAGLTLNDMVEYEQKIGPLPDADKDERQSVEGMLYQLFLSARRGGYQGGHGELGGLIEVNDLPMVTKALAQLMPAVTGDEKKEEPEAAE